MRLSSCWAAALVPLLTDAFSARLRFPGVVLEIALGIVVGPSLLGWVTDEPLIELVANFGLAMLMFLAGYEIDFLRVRGKPMTLALGGWGASVAIGIGLGFLVNLWLDVPWIYVALAISTTAIGTLLPILRDSGEIATRLGTFLLAAGAVGEFGPIVAVSLVLQGHRPTRTIVVLLIFAAIAIVGHRPCHPTASGPVCPRRWRARLARALSSRCGWRCCCSWAWCGRPRSSGWTSCSGRSPVA